MNRTMKKLTKIKLINWHYFANETIDINGSFLISGDNGSGKSTILDAVQMVLTTNSRRFNPAANEKSKRDLKGYVRCKTGEEGNTYVRTGAVISFIALEFYEESRNRWFVMGVKMDSPDPDSDIKRKWFLEEGRMEDLTFIVKNKPAVDSQFMHGTRKVSLIQSSTEAKARFKTRMGHLDDKFFDLIPKSLAFKPMDNVKNFINRYILPERNIEVGMLRENIRNLRELQTLIEEVRSNIQQLADILSVHDDILNFDEQILVIELLVFIAELESYKEQLENKRLDRASAEGELNAIMSRLEGIAGQINTRELRLREIDAQLAGNPAASRINSLRQQIERIEDRLKTIRKNRKTLQEQNKNMLSAVRALGLYPELAGKGIQDCLLNPQISVREKNRLLADFEKQIDRKTEEVMEKRYQTDNKCREIEAEMRTLEKEIQSLENNQLIYPENTMKLKGAIEQEMSRRGISCDVHVLADLLEINDPHWQDAVEGYLNTQRFNLIVEPKYYDIAAEVYNREKKRIHSVMLVNTGKLLKYTTTEENTLASVVTCENHYARLYANYLLNRVVCCENVQELKEYSVAVTSECMLYQGHALRKIDPRIYQTPYIGHSALERQLAMKRARYAECRKNLADTETALKELRMILSTANAFNPAILKTHLDAPAEEEKETKELKELKSELKAAESDPTVIELQMKEQEVSEKLSLLKKEQEALQNSRADLRKLLEDTEREIRNLEAEISAKQEEIDHSSYAHMNALADARKRYAENARQKNSDTIAANYIPRKHTLENQRRGAYEKLIKLQAGYFSGEFGTGEEVMTEYRNEHTRLIKQDLLKYEEQLRKAKEDCELEFREHFLAKMRENIQNARQTFRDLNKALQSTYYGNDSYQFLLDANKQKKSLYDMINSEMNIGDGTLFASFFEDQYQQEMDELFARLTESDEKGDAILSEYTDYRSYLDYDIQIRSRDGKIQHFSKTYGEKSGGETQTPYYVAIAASFQQIYSNNETIRIVMLDEAFDKMDDERISSMMSFFKSCGFQLILATPPAKMEVIGEHIDTVLIAYHENNVSMIERYAYEEL